MTTALIDGDILLYRIGFASEDSEEWIAAARIQELFESIITNTRADSFRLFLTPTNKDVFRYTFYPEYKANRPAKPKHYAFLRQYCLDNLAAEVKSGYEADDLLGIAQSADMDNTVICTIDKDLFQVGGNFYNFVKNKFIFISPEDAPAFYYQQCLTGDNTDNIPGLRGIGPSRAQKYIGELRNPEDLILHCLKKWEDSGKTVEDFCLTSRLVYVLRKENQYVPNELRILLNDETDIYKN